MNQTFNNQVMFGRREWSILTDNNKPEPIEKEGRPLADKPLVVEDRKPSEVDNEYNGGPNIVGYMGDDEDIEQAKYDVISEVNNKFTTLDDRIIKISSEIEEMMVQLRKYNQGTIAQMENDIRTLIDELAKEDKEIKVLEADACGIECFKQKTIQGCYECIRQGSPKKCSSPQKEHICNDKIASPVNTDCEDMLTYDCEYYTETKRDLCTKKKSSPGRCFSKVETTNNCLEKNGIWNTNPGKCEICDGIIKKDTNGQPNKCDPCLGEIKPGTDSSSPSCVLCQTWERLENKKCSPSPCNEKDYVDVKTKQCLECNSPTDFADKLVSLFLPIKSRKDLHAGSTKKNSNKCLISWWSAVLAIVICCIEVLVLVGLAWNKLKKKKGTAAEGDADAGAGAGPPSPSALSTSASAGADSGAGAGARPWAYWLGVALAIVGLLVITFYIFIIISVHRSELYIYDYDGLNENIWVSMVEVVLRQ